MGLALTAAPWTSLWDQHPLLNAAGAMRAIVTAPWFRGSITGLGLINLGAAVYDVVELVRGARRS